MEHDKPGTLNSGWSGWCRCLAAIILLTTGFTVDHADAQDPQPRLTCEMDVPVVVVDYANVRYLPMPIPVTVTVTNSGTALANPVTARIIVPPDLMLAGDDAPDGYEKSLQPFWLFPRQTGQVQWMLRHPPTTVEMQYMIQVWVKTSNADSTLCEKKLIIPPLDSPILAPRCYVPDSLHFDEGADSYIPNPFTVRLTCVNNGNPPTYEVTDTLILPPDVELVNPGDSLTKHYIPSTLEKWWIGDPVPELTWLVRWVPRLRYEVRPEFRFTVTGESYDGIRLDSTEVRCFTRIHGLLPLFASCLKIPDSLSRRADGFGVEPNPFTARYVIWNRSHQTGSIKRVYISFPPDGLDLNPASPTPRDLTTDVNIAPGDSAVFEWLIDVVNRRTRRMVQFNSTAINDQGYPIECMDWLPIAATVDSLGTPRLDGNCEGDVARLDFDKPHARYIPDSFKLIGSIWNAGMRDLHGVSVNITWVNPRGDHLEELDLVELDPDSVGNERSRLHDILQPGDSLHYTWKFRLKEWNRTWSMRYARFFLEAGAEEFPLTSIGNETRAEIAPSKILTSTGEPLQAGFTLQAPYPNPFRSSTTIFFNLPQSGPVTLTVTDVLGREVRRLLDGAQTAPGAHAVRLDGGGLQPGLYLCTLNDGVLYVQRSIVLLR